MVLHHANTDPQKTPCQALKNIFFLSASTWYTFESRQPFPNTSHPEIIKFIARAAQCRSPRPEPRAVYASPHQQPSRKDQPKKNRSK